MAIENFHNQNEYRSYPLKANQAESNLSRRLIVDARFEVSAPAAFIPGTDLVWLRLVYFVPSSNLLQLRFRRTDAGGGDELTFTCAADSAEFTTFYATGTNWSGHITVGQPMDAITSFYTAEQTALEPCVTRLRTKSVVRTWNIANNSRILATDPSACAPAAAPSRTVHSIQTGITSLVTIQAGFNATVAISADNQSITLGGLVGGGMGEPCSEIPTHAADVAIDGGPLTGGLWCNETIKSIDGVQGPNIQMVPGTGITILGDDTDPHMLRITADLRNLLGPNRYLDASSSL